MNWNDLDWTTLLKLRKAFLSETQNLRHEWRSLAELEAYELTFAQRIGWKWESVLRDLAKIGWEPKPETLIDWGCGTGIASRKYLKTSLPQTLSRIEVSDKSKMAEQFAMNNLREEFPESNIRVWDGKVRDRSLFLISHVLNHLTTADLEKLIVGLKQSGCFVWVESGLYSVSRKLIEIRESFMDTFRVIAPCTHQAPCPLLNRENHTHWCHHFGKTPPHVFQDPHWAEYAKRMSIDLRSLPYSYLVMDRLSHPFPGAQTRIIGKPRTYKGFIKALACNASGISEMTVTRQKQPQIFSCLKKGQVII